MALADSQYAATDSKLAYDFWRPVQAIAEAATDANADTLAVAGWTPVHPTPDSPDYPSAHASGGDAAIAVLQHVFPAGAAFSTTSSSLEGVTRRYDSFEQAAAENAISRVYVGFHFRHATIVGRALGQQVGDWAVQQHLLPR